MFSEMIREAMERQLVGQDAAVNSVARGITRLASSLTPSERSWCAYLLMGAHGTGRGHLVRTVARILYGRESVLTVSCKVGGHADPWLDFLRRLEPLASSTQPRASAGSSSTPSGVGSPGFPPRLVLVQDLERAPKDLYPQLAYLLESGQEMLPSGCLRLDHCILFFSTSLCSDQILDQSRLGFSGSAADGEGDTLYRICREESENTFGRELMGQFDDLIVFNRLGAEELAGVLDRHFARMEAWLEGRGIRCALAPAAKAHLLERASGESLAGAHELVRAHRDEVEFPIADLLLSGALEPGDTLRIDHHDGDGHLHFSVEAPEGDRASSSAAPREIPVVC